MAKRIQRKRTKGWKMPEGAVYVGRPTRWGNPFYHAQRFAGLKFSLRCFRMAAEGYWNPFELKDMPDGPFHIACKDFSEWIKRFPVGAVNTIRAELHGKDLVCWCPLDKPCHADVLLEIANASAQPLSGADEKMRAVLEWVAREIEGDSDVLPMYAAEIRNALERRLLPLLLAGQANRDNYAEVIENMNKRFETSVQAQCVHNWDAALAAAQGQPEKESGR